MQRRLGLVCVAFVALLAFTGCDPGCPPPCPPGMECPYGAPDHCWGR